MMESHQLNVIQRRLVSESPLGGTHHRSFPSNWDIQAHRSSGLQYNTRSRMICLIQNSIDVEVYMRISYTIRSPTLIIHITPAAVCWPDFLVRYSTNDRHSDWWWMMLTFYFLLHIRSRHFYSEGSVTESCASFGGHCSPPPHICIAADYLFLEFFLNLTF